MTESMPGGLKDQVFKYFHSVPTLKQDIAMQNVVTKCKVGKRKTLVLYTMW